MADTSGVKKPPKDQWAQVFQKLGDTEHHDKWISCVRKLAGKVGDAKNLRQPEQHKSKARPQVRNFDEASLSLIIIRPQIIRALETAHATLTQLSGGEAVPYLQTLSKDSTDLQKMGHAYLALVKVVADHRIRYKEVELRGNLFPELSQTRSSNELGRIRSRRSIDFS
jgi:hypothetical protein